MNDTAGEGGVEDAVEEEGVGFDRGGGAAEGEVAAGGEGGAEGQGSGADGGAGGGVEVIGGVGGDVDPFGGDAALAGGDVRVDEGSVAVLGDEAAGADREVRQREDGVAGGAQFEAAGFARVECVGGDRDRKAAPD